MDEVSTSNSGIELPLLPKREVPISDSINSNMEEAVTHTRHDGVESNSISSCDAITNRKSANIHVESTTDRNDQTLLGRLRNILSSVSWGMEIVAIITSFASMGVLVWVLALFQNRPLTDWSFWISLNAVVAIAATTAKATLLAAISACLSQEKWQHFSHRSHRLQDMAIIDYASRGAVGSMQMLLKVSWGFASVSAIVTVLSLATDVFVQQITKYESGTMYTLVEESAYIYYTHGYSSGAIVISEDIYNHTIIYQDWTVDTPMRMAILDAVYDINMLSTFSPVGYVCRSDCIWDQEITTLGFTSTCVDVTEETLATMHCLNSTDDKEFGNCKLFTPGGIQFDTSARDNISSIENDLTIAVRASNLRYDVGPVLTGSDLFRVAVWIWDNRDNGTKELGVECSLAAVAYKHSNISTTFTELNIGTTEKIALGNNSGATIDHPYSSPGDNLLWWNDTNTDQPDIYISLLDLVVLADFFQSPSFSGGYSSVTSSGNSHPGAVEIFHRCTDPADDVVKSCISGIFDRITTSMTSQLVSDREEVAIGLTNQSIVYIRVRWVWLILPLAVQFLGGIAIVVTIIGRDRTKNVPLWKGSTLAVLYHSVDEHGVFVPSVKNPKELDEIGKRVEAVLDQ